MTGEGVNWFGRGDFIVDAVLSEELHIVYSLDLLSKIPNVDSAHLRP